MVLDPETVAFLESGSALIVGTVSDDGVPRATRGHGLNVLRGDALRVRLLLDGDDPLTVEHARAGGRIAITAASVPTLRSLQLKGRATAVEPATDADRDRAHQYSEEFFDDITRSDGTPRVLLERIRPGDYVAATVEVDEVFDQTPGPSAGAQLPGAQLPGDRP